MNIVVERSNTEFEVNCIFCGKDLGPSDEKVRYRGAISCVECANKQKGSAEPVLRPFYYLAGIGCIVGMLTFAYFTAHVFLFSNIDPESYIQPLVPFYGGLTITVALLSLGLYAINRVHLFIASIVGVLVSIYTSVISGLAVYDVVVNGPYFVIEEITFTKTVNYYSSAIGAYSLFAFVIALAILLHMTNIKTEIVSIAAAALFLLATTIAMSIFTWLIAGFINILVYLVAFVFFVTRRRIYEEAAIQPL